MTNKVNVPPGPNVCSNPPHWRWNPRKSGGTPPRRARRPEGAPLQPWPSWRSVRRRLWTEVWYQGGPEGSCHVACRGWVFVFPADVAIWDVIQTINGVPPKSYR